MGEYYIYRLLTIQYLVQKILNDEWEHIN